MKYLILALLATFSLSVSAGKPTKDQMEPSAPVQGNTIKLCGSGDPLKGLNVSKGGNPKAGGKLCEDGMERKGAPNNAGVPGDKTPPKK